MLNPFSIFRRFLSRIFFDSSPEAAPTVDEEDAVIATDVDEEQKDSEDIEISERAVIRLDSSPFEKPDPLPGSWQVAGASIRGASHDKSGLPNQDALEWCLAATDGPTVAAAVADGHGNPRCFRSDIGSKLAVKAAMESLREFAKAHDADLDPRLVRDHAERLLPQVITNQWTKAVQAHIADSPISPDELNKLTDQEGDSARAKVEENQVKAYGCTLLASLVGDRFILFLQIGDSEILTVNENAEVTAPLPEDPRHFANETTSLSGTQASQNFRVSFRQLSDDAPALVLLCTDGYSNAFPPKDFLHVSQEWVEFFRTDGVTAVQESLPELLLDASCRGSGDDVTLILLFRTDSCEDEWTDWRAASEANQPKQEPSEEHDPGVIAAETANSNSQDADAAEETTRDLPADAGQPQVGEESTMTLDPVPSTGSTKEAKPTEESGN